MKAQDVVKLEYDLQTYVLKCFNQKGHLIYNKKVSWNFYVAFLLKWEEKRLKDE